MQKTRNYQARQRVLDETEITDHSQSDPGRVHEERELIMNTRNFPTCKNLRRKLALERFAVQLDKLLGQVKQDPELQGKIDLIKQWMTVTESRVITNPGAVRTKKSREGMGKIGR